MLFAIILCCNTWSNYSIRCGILVFTVAPIFLQSTVCLGLYAPKEEEQHGMNKHLI